MSHFLLETELSFLNYIAAKRSATLATDDKAFTILADPRETLTGREWYTESIDDKILPFPRGIASEIMPFNELL